VRSEIDKHKEALNDLKKNRSFLLQLTPEEFTRQRDQRI
jgi:hypothetical protein